MPAVVRRVFASPQATAGLMPGFPGFRVAQSAVIRGKEDERVLVFACFFQSCHDALHFPVEHTSHVQVGRGGRALDWLSAQLRRRRMRQVDGWRPVAEKEGAVACGVRNKGGRFVGQHFV